MSGNSTPPPESWKALLVVGCLFPLHIILGLVLLPTLIWLVLTGSTIALVVLLIYIPFYLYPAQRKFPGWKGFEALWRVMDYSNTCRSYFSEFEVHGGENVDADEQYFMACHPHGTVIFQRMFWRTKQMAQLFKRDWRMLGASALFRIPLVRETSLFFGAVDASRENCKQLLDQGVNVVVWPGGLDEANTVENDHGSVVIRTRTGFVRLAVEAGVTVLPIFVFGELESVRAISPLPEIVTQYLRTRFRMSSTIFLGRWKTFIPFRVPFHLCIGKPIPVTRLTPGTPEFENEVARVYRCYKDAINALYHQNRDEFGYRNRPLVFACESDANIAATLARKND